MAERPARVLVVDDEKVVRYLAERMLALAGYAVTSCATGEEALEAFAAQPDGFDILLSDLHLGGMSGLALAEEIRRLRPSIAVVVMSGESEAQARDEGMDPWTRFLAKPYRRDELAAAVADALRARPADT